MYKYLKTTNKITVSVEPFFLIRQKVEKDQYVWGYKVLIQNNTDTSILIKSRNWSIIDIYGNIKIMNTDGIMGESPLILEGNSYEYMNGLSLAHAGGFVFGQYVCASINMNNIVVDIPEFPIISPFLGQSNYI